MQKTGKVLVVDDYEPNLRGLGQLLEHADYTVFTATNGLDALEIVKTERPDLVLLDVLMPGISGLEVCTEIKRNPETHLTPVVLISGTHERGTRVAGLNAGADDYIRKPFSQRLLLERVRAVLRRADSKPSQSSGNRPTVRRGCSSRVAPPSRTRSSPSGRTWSLRGVPSARCAAARCHLQPMAGVRPAARSSPDPSAAPGSRGAAKTRRRRYRRRDALRGVYRDSVEGLRTRAVRLTMEGRRPCSHGG